MVKKTLLFASLFVLFFFACNKMSEKEENAAETAGMEAMAAEEAEIGNLEEEGTASASLKLPLDFSDANKMIDNILLQKFMSVVMFIYKYLLIIWYFFLSWPFWLRIIIYIAAFTAAVTIIASQIIGIYRKKDVWQKHPAHELMYSYFVFSGNYRRRESYKEARELVYDKTEFWYSLAGLAYRLGNYSNTSSIIIFLLSFVYMPLTVLGAFEMVLRCIFGTIWLFVCSKILQLFFFITRIISLLLIPFSKIIDKLLLNTQYCPQCYQIINLPYFVCPSCNTVHKELVPGRCGVLFVRCACNNTFIPCTAFTGRSSLDAKCKDCGTELAAANPKHFSIAVTGGNDSGKTAFIAAFSKTYMKKRYNLTFIGKPKSAFDELFRAFDEGNTKSDTEPCAYSIIHKSGSRAKDNLVFYDTMDESILSESFARSPKYLGYCDGIILLIDPLSVKSVRNEHRESLNTRDMETHSDDDIDHLTNQFINIYFRIRGHSTGTMCDVPIAVVINKTDIAVVNKEIGEDAIGNEYDKDCSLYKNVQEAENCLCREYLVKIGLQNLINNIEASFSNVRYFSASAIGHTAQDGKKFEPIGEVSPIIWIAKQRGTRLIKYITNIRSSNIRIKARILPD